MPENGAPGPHGRVRLSVSSGRCSSAGRKPVNQDACGIVRPDGGLLAAKGIAAAVADGISTSPRGGEAAATAVESFLADYLRTSEGWSVRSSAESVIAAVNSALHARNGRPLCDEERERGLICTFSALVLKSRSAYLFHVGDARIARLRGGRIEPLTAPHVVSVGGGKSYLGRALGIDRHVEIDARRIAVERGDLFLLTTDGVHDHLPDDRIAALLHDAGCLDDAAASLVAAARAAGSEDNLTALLMRIDTLPEGGVDDVLGSEIILPPAPLLTPGGLFEQYRILREIHAGPRSHLYLAAEPDSERPIVLKVPSTEHAADPAKLRALLLEEWVARRIDHPHVLKAAPQARGRGHIFAAFEYVKGQTLDQWMRDHPAPELTAVRSLIGQIAAGLLALHKREMLHRDLRPHNILVDGQGTATIIDFGSVQVAGLDELATIEIAEDAAYAGTLQYGAPELYLGHAAGPASDLFSLGVIAYQMLTGHLPYGPRVAAARTRAAQRRLHYTPATAHNPAVPDWVDAAIAKAVAIDPGQRYALLSEFTYDLSHPNPALAAADTRPLFQRDPVLAWKALSGILFALLLLSIFAR
ncbi:bifunctional protein-serine/threonine kinase/phosphatase [Sphingosinicella sp. BN140058]|uniref:bifunctional protein-serine/threonine kinase/phosphatase n=1 Tax=Sphingosinicella sp. BN140058 TaxID=1892855 RepID=UPI0010124205|nr:bifunctional protein-serine/threonine kinase/phosphatase [Sphingosinicella sp. BN140058]QAY76399.1 serine/threonine protein kinase [Sphingosinicella sp. BN140058]